MPPTTLFGLGYGTGPAGYGYPPGARRPSISYPDSPFTWYDHVEITASSPTNGGGPITGYVVLSGTLPDGVSLNATTGELTGTPTAQQSAASVVIRARGPGGVSDTTIGVEVLAMPLSLGTSLAAWYKADAGCYTDAACLFASASSQYLSKTSPTFAPTTKMTIAFDFKPSSMASAHDVVSRYDGADNQFIVRVNSSGTITVFVCDSAADTGNNYFTTTSAVVSNGVNARIVVIYDGTLTAANRVAVYVDGSAAAGSVTGTLPTALSVCTGALRVGGEPGIAFSNGALARLGFSSLALSGAALTAAHTSTFWADMTAARQADWFSFYNLCEASSTRVDSTGLNNLTPTNGPTVAAGPGEGLATNNSPVKRVEDQSGNARHLLQSTIASQPLWMAAIQNGRPILRFDGVDDVLVRNNTVPPWDADASGISYFACAAQRDATPVGWVIGGSPSEGWSNEPAGGISFDTSRQPGASLYDGAAYREVRGSAVSLGVFSSIVSSYDPSDAFLRVVVDGTDANGSHAMDTSQSAIFMIVGRSSNPAVSFGFVDVAECGIGSLALTASGRSGAATYLKTRFATP